MCKGWLVGLCVELPEFDASCWVVVVWWIEAAFPGDGGSKDGLLIRLDECSKLDVQDFGGEGKVDGAGLVSAAEVQGGVGPGCVVDRSVSVASDSGCLHDGCGAVAGVADVHDGYVAGHPKGAWLDGCARVLASVKVEAVERVVVGPEQGVVVGEVCWEPSGHGSVSEGHVEGAHGQVDVHVSAVLERVPAKHALCVGWDARVCLVGLVAEPAGGGEVLVVAADGVVAEVERLVAESGAYDFPGFVWQVGEEIGGVHGCVRGCSHSESVCCVCVCLLETALDAVPLAVEEAACAVGPRALAGVLRCFAWLDASQASVPGLDGADDGLKTLCVCGCEAWYHRAAG